MEDPLFGLLPFICGEGLEVLGLKKMPRRGAAAPRPLAYEVQLRGIGKSSPKIVFRPAAEAKRSEAIRAKRVTGLGLLGPPVVPFYPFLGTRTDYRKKGTLILTSLLEDLGLDNEKVVYTKLGLFGATHSGSEIC